MKQRRKQPVQTRQAIFMAVEAEFSVHGYSGSGLGGIVARAGLTKGALFHHFPDKRALAVAWISEPLTAAIHQEWIGPMELIASLEGFLKHCRGACLGMKVDGPVAILSSLAAETSSSEPLLGEALGKIFAGWRDALAAVLERGKSEGWIHRNIQPATESAFLVSSISGFSVTHKCHPDEAARRTYAAALEGYLETLRAQ